MSELLPGDQLHSFPGGLKLRHHKQVSCQQPMARSSLPDHLYLPLVQHQGPPGKLLVSPGESVLKGQPLTTAEDDSQVPIHAPTSGTILAVDQLHPVSWPPGSRAACVVLAPDGDDRQASFEPLADTRPDAVVDHLNRLGLAGLGGAVFPTAAKLRGDWPGLHTVIINGAECEPWISCDEMLMRERTEAIISGGVILARTVGASQVVIALEDRMGTVEAKFARCLREQPPALPVKLRQVTTIYPEGGERQLIQVLTGREVPHQGLPQDLGVVCHNVATAAAVHDAVIEGKPLIERVVTVTGPGIAQPRNFIAALGTPIAHLVAQAGGYTGPITRLVLGGPMSGLALASDEIPVAKGTICILALTEDVLSRRQSEMPCINCGECVRVCPASLLPQQIFRHLAADNLAAAERLNLSACIECGCCAQVCPSHIPLVEHYRHGKHQLIVRQLDQRRAALARRRHEAREQRLVRERAERQARRAERKKRLSEPEQARDEIQAALERARRKQKP